MKLLAGFTHTRLITGHDLDMILAICPRVVILKEGKVAADGLTRVLLADPVLMAECGLEVPALLLPCSKCGHVPCGGQVSCN
jgi:cobalt/nickel transport system ATP-binding protein